MLTVTSFACGHRSAAIGFLDDACVALGISDPSGESRRLPNRSSVESVRQVPPVGSGKFLTASGSGAPLPGPGGLAWRPRCQNWNGTEGEGKSKSVIGSGSDRSMLPKFLSGRVSEPALHRVPTLLQSDTELYRGGVRLGRNCHRRRAVDPQAGRLHRQCLAGSDQHATDRCGGASSGEGALQMEGPAA